MKISKVEIFKLNIPYTEPFVISLGPITDAENIVVKIHTDKGITGTGECSPFVYIVGETQDSAFEIAKSIAALIMGEDPLDLNRLIDKIDGTFAGNNTIRGAFDMALHDISAQHASVPMYRLFGGSNSRKIVSNMTVGLGDPGHMALKARQHIDEGFIHLKVKLGTTFEEDVLRIKLIREAIGTKPSIRIDANQGWDKTTAIKILNEIDQYNIEYCEEPVSKWNNRDMATVTASSPIPIMADESLSDHRDAFRLASMEACDMFNIKLAKSGGLRNATKILAVADSAGIPCQVGCMGESRLAITALVHLSMAYRNILYFDLDPPIMHSSDPVTGGITIEADGNVILPDSIGLGADIDPMILESAESFTVV